MQERAINAATCSPLPGHTNSILICVNQCAFLVINCRVFEYEARAAAALQQAATEEEKLDKVTKAAAQKQEMLDAAFKSVKVRRSVSC